MGLEKDDVFMEKTEVGARGIGYRELKAVVSLVVCVADVIPPPPTPTFMLYVGELLLAVINLAACDELTGKRGEQWRCIPMAFSQKKQEK